MKAVPIKHIYFVEVDSEIWSRAFDAEMMQMPAEQRLPARLKQIPGVEMEYVEGRWGEGVPFSVANESNNEETKKAVFAAIQLFIERGSSRKGGAR